MVYSYHERNYQIYLARLEGQTLKQISQNYGVSVGRVWQIYNKIKIARQRQKVEED